MGSGGGVGESEGGTRAGKGVVIESGEGYSAGLKLLWIDGNSDVPSAGPGAKPRDFDGTGQFDFRKPRLVLLLSTGAMNACDGSAGWPDEVMAPADL